jgi:GxxExxY protein
VTENELATIAVDVAYQVHRRLGPGLLEEAYHAILVYELRQRGLQVKSKWPVPIEWGQLRIDKAFEADVIIEDLLLLELKSVETVAAVHKKQVLTYLRLLDLRLGLLINFGSELVKDGISRIANALPE